MDDRPIGVFDSGVGGLTVARAIIDQLPAERIRYLGDTAHAPYGPRPLAEVREFALKATDRLVASDIKMLVIACNTASAAGVYTQACARYDIPVVEVIRPAVRRAVVASGSGRIGVIGTTATIASGAYQVAVAELDPSTRVSAVACPSFVDFVERGITSGRQLVGLAQAYLAPLRQYGVDTLVLGCTHYPLLIGALALVMGPAVTLVSSAEETAKEVYQRLTEADALTGHHGTPQHEFAATGDPAYFARVGRRFLGPEIGAVLPG